ncbi:hypothetical protein GCM10022256_06880 [Frondihabitans peucedani]|uniref:Transposase n=1 Tax=Frondihabitans peucedani TaxID=598626 RepID=A0ABP8DYU9_9MICO
MYARRLERPDFRRYGRKNDQEARISVVLRSPYIWTEILERWAPDPHEPGGILRISVHMYARRLGSPNLRRYGRREAGRARISVHLYKQGAEAHGEGRQQPE